MAIKKSDLYSSIWASCDELRGGIPQAEIEDCLSPRGEGRYSWLQGGWIMAFSAQ